MEYKDFLETMRSFYKMGFGVSKTSLDLMKVAADSYVSLYEVYLRQVVPSEVFDSVKKSVEMYSESQAKVFENFRKLLDQLEKQQDEIFKRMIELTEKAQKKEKQ
ncbi:hypothetical protein GAH_01711 [Geoglobus ahangari]|uniref:Phasin family protein n=1 Tax=Geoglobus ahangari TaxID=113653 RepID=A0A0F7DBF6_9EURY|nr:hypothetical protein [Geoglobus ahangari]AKG91006.1 hypothetical protein GAH_01711 [Geoglobus ahangari]NOY11461.1 hypothetical protein [Archaeoglobi archaeon]